MVRVGERENVSSGKKYLEEVMGIVEDEEFNRKRKLKALRQKQTSERPHIAKTENLNDFSDSDPTWCGTKVRMMGWFLLDANLDLEITEGIMGAKNIHF